MAKRFKLKLSRVFPSSLQFCRSKHSSTLAQTPYRRLSPINPKAFDIGFPNHLPAPPPSTPEHSFIKRHVSSSKVTPVACGGCRSDYDVVKSSSPPNWKKFESRSHTKIYDVSSDGDISPVWVNEKTKKKKRKKNTIASVSSDCFSSEYDEDENEETETLISSSDCSSFDSSMRSDSWKKIRGLKQYKTAAFSETEVELESRRKGMIPATVYGKVRESVAVEKKSKDPYEDFKRSMLEMILEKEMFEAKELEELLQCFLSLNMREYHAIIVEAFAEIWEALFCDSSSPVKGQQRISMGF